MQNPASSSLSRGLLAAALATSLFVAGCATDSEHRSRNTGAIIGAIAGAIIGNNVGGDQSDRVIGAAAGAMVGAAVGDYMDRQRADLERQLANEREREQLRITEVGDNTLKLGIASDATFEFDRSEIQPQFRSTYDKIGTVLSDYDKTVIHVVGHTDSVGSDRYNLQLSRDRAEAVGRALRERGVDGNRIIYYGQGEKQPVASNETDEGRRRNRRVEIYIKPKVEGEERRAYEPPPGIYA
ncbi:MAG: OmpA family protein [Halofilum sp. (in: g-proteobacteria)]|nr:OmpA family protein [Halofilum sp. (in: g-proteobacteria)]